MNDSLHARELLLAYLLGELSPEEQQATEERMLIEQSFSDRLQEAEYDLIDDYYAGRLTPSEQRRVEAALPQERLFGEFSRSLDTKASVAPLYPQRSSSWLRWSVAAASFALLALVGWLVHFDLSRPAAKLPDIAKRATSSDQSNAATASASGNAGQDTTAVLLLASDVVRGPNSIPLDLRLATRTVLVQWAVPPRVGARSFRLSVTKDGRVLSSVLQDGELRSIGGRQVAEFRLDPVVLRDGAGESHLLLLIHSGDVPYPVEAEFPVTVSRR